MPLNRREKALVRGGADPREVYFMKAYQSHVDNGELDNVNSEENGSGLTPQDLDYIKYHKLFRTK